MFPKFGGAGWPGPLSVVALLTWNPVPKVPKVMPRGEFTLKKSNGKVLGAAKFAGTVSQLISRRTPPKEPFAPAVVPPPMAARKLSRAAVAAAVPAPEKTVCARVVPGKSALRMARTRAQGVFIQVCRGWSGGLASFPGTFYDRHEFAFGQDPHAESPT